MSTAPAYVPVPLKVLDGDWRVEFDLHVKLNDKHVLFLRKGTYFDAARLEKLRKRGVLNMWIPEEERPQLLKFIERQTRIAYSSTSGRPLIARSRIIRVSIIPAIDAFFNGHKAVSLYQECLNQAKKLTEFFLNDKHALKIMLTAASGETSIAAHGLNVASIALALAKELEISGTKDLHLLALGCMVHDVGHVTEPAGFGKNLSEMSVNEKSIFEKHPAGGATFFDGVAHIDQQVLHIIQEHEEQISGTGLPKGLKESQMHAYSLIAATANSFDHLLTYNGETPVNAARRLIKEKVGCHPVLHLNALTTIVQRLEDSKK